MSDYFSKIVKKAGEKLSDVNLDKFSQKVSSYVEEASHFVRQHGSTAAESFEQAVSNLPVNMPPKVDIENYKVKVMKLLDEGGYSYVFLVKDMMTGEEYALKRLLIQDKEMYKNAKEEIDFMKQLTGHENIIKLLATTEHKSAGTHEVYILMEFAKGSLISMLQKKLDDKSQFSEEEVLRIFLQICKAVGHMHAQNPPVTHRDLKVENVLLGMDGKFKLCDFGSATTLSFNPSASKRDMLAAEEDVARKTTMAYRSPEMVDLYSGHIIDTKSDVWALGCVLYKMCYFVGPFEEGGNMSIINCKYRIPDQPKYSSKITSMIKWILNTDPSKRPDVFDLIKRVSEDLGVSSDVKKPINVPKATTQKQPTPATPTKKASPVAPAQNQGGDLFSMLDWQGEGGGDNSAPAPKPNSPVTVDEEWQADFSDFDDGFAKPRAPAKKPTPTPTPPTPSKVATVPASPAKVVQAKPPLARQQSLDIKASKNQGGDLFSQLEWSDGGNDSPQSATMMKSNWGEDEDEETKPKKSAKKSHGRSRSDIGMVLDGMQSSDLISISEKPKESITEKVKNALDMTDLKDLAVATFTNNKKLSVVKATSSKLSEPKQKYIRKISNEIWKSKDITPYLIHFRSRPVFQNPIICVKTLVALHHIIQDCPIEVLKQLRDKMTLFVDIRDVWTSEKGNDPVYSKLIQEYSSYLINRLRFNQRFTMFEGNFSLDYFMQSDLTRIDRTIGKEAPVTVQVTSELLDLMAQVDKVQALAFKDRANSCKMAALVPCIYDFEDIYQAALFLLHKLSTKVQQKDLAGVLSQYSSSYNAMVNFYSTAKKYKPLASLVVIPELPMNPPNVFSAMAARPPTSNLPPSQLKRKQLGNLAAYDNDEDSDLDEEEEKDIDSAPYVESPREKSNDQLTIEEVLKQDGNDVCAECNVQFPKWASINLGVFICQNCSGLHRGLGVHISKVRSTSLDNWSIEQIQFMSSIGNKKANEYWEATLPNDKKLTPSTDKADIDKFIRDKYEKKLYIAKPQPKPKKTNSSSTLKPTPVENFAVLTPTKPTQASPAVKPMQPAPMQQPFTLNQPMFTSPQRPPAQPYGMMPPQQGFGQPMQPMKPAQPFGMTPQPYMQGAPQGYRPPNMMQPQPQYGVMQPMKQPSPVTPTKQNQQPNNNFDNFFK